MNVQNLNEKSVVVDTKFVQDTELNRSENCAGSIPNEYSEGTADICIGQTEEYECIPENGEYALFDSMEMLRDDACLGTGISDMSSSGMDVDSGIVAENLSSGGLAECYPEQEALLAENPVGCDPEQETVIAEDPVGCDPEREERTADGDDAGTEIIEIPLEKLKIHPKNVRKKYEDIKELTQSIRENGILQNLTVVPDPDEAGMYLVVIGNRRLTAARAAGIKAAPCCISQMSEKEQIMTMLTENMQRKGLKVYEEAAGVQMCLEDFGFTAKEVSERTGLSQTTIRHRANIAKLDGEVLRQRADDGAFQLSIKDLTKLEKVKSVEKRNEILNAASDSRDLAWRAESAAKTEKCERNKKKLLALAKKEGIEEAPEGTKSEMYTNKWEVLAKYELSEDVPKELYDGEKKGVLYLIYYGTFKLIRKAKKTKRVLAPFEIREREEKKRKRQIKEIYKAMHAEMGEFIRGIIGGKIEELDDTTELVRSLWKLLLSRHSFISSRNIVCTLLGKETEKASPQEIEDQTKLAADLPLHQAMLAVAYWEMRDMVFLDYRGNFRSSALWVDDLCP